eukprot:SAG22_NODE_1211_length_5159_cov_105.112253_2_plen_159_part_00
MSQPNCNAGRSARLLCEKLAGLQQGLVADANAREAAAAVAKAVAVAAHAAAAKAKAEAIAHRAAVVGEVEAASQVPARAPPAPCPLSVESWGGRGVEAGSRCRPLLGTSYRPGAVARLPGLSARARASLMAMSALTHSRFSSLLVSSVLFRSRRRWMG